VEHIVTSSDGVKFVVASDERTVPFDIAFAAAHPASALRAHGDFAELKTLDVLFSEEELKLPRISGPLEKRKAFRVIRGGKPS
jgi:hypothetical protein